MIENYLTIALVAIICMMHSLVHSLVIALVAILCMMHSLVHNNHFICVNMVGLFVVAILNIYKNIQINYYLPIYISIIYIYFIYIFNELITKFKNTLISLKNKKKFETCDSVHRNIIDKHKNMFIIVNICSVIIAHNLNINIQVKLPIYILLISINFIFIFTQLKINCYSECRTNIIKKKEKNIADEFRRGTIHNVVQNDQGKWCYLIFEEYFACSHNLLPQYKTTFCKNLTQSENNTNDELDKKINFFMDVSINITIFIFIQLFRENEYYLISGILIMILISYEIKLILHYIKISNLIDKINTAVSNINTAVSNIT